jgi:DNA adenine methylase
MTTAIPQSTAQPRPFVKWAGGKSTVIAEIARRLPPAESLERYIEPFVGGGAMFFWIREIFPRLRCRIADRNHVLVSTYLAIRDGVDEVIEELRRHADAHSEEHFYAVRRLQPSRPAEQAALFIYLNRTCYNGLWRVNRRGEFNVPLGRYANPRILDEQNLRRVSQILRGAEILCADFEEAVADCRPGDLVYFDPPYHPLSATSRFTTYTAHGFDEEEQERLARVFWTSRNKGAAVLLSNSDTEWVRGLYEKMDPPPRIDRVRVPRSINSKGIGRGAIDELLLWTPGDGGTAGEADDR